MDGSSCQRALLINNVGTLGDISKYIRDYSDLDDLSRNTSVNLTSLMATTFVTSFSLTTVGSFFGNFPHASILLLLIFHLFLRLRLFLAGAFMGWPRPVATTFMLYLQQRFVHIVHFDVKGVRTLNYAPGPLDTDMQGEVRSKLVDVSGRQMFLEMHEQVRNPMTKLTKGKAFEARRFCGEISKSSRKRHLYQRLPC